MDIKSVAQVLDEAADLIAAPGAWMQGDYCDGLLLRNSSCFCLEGAVARVLGVDPMQGEEWCDEYLSPLALNHQNAALWNDAPERTQAEVVAKLREAAAKAREQAA